MRATITALKERLDVESWPYLAALADGRFDRGDFVETQKQFLYAVVFFSRPMAVLAARMPRPEQRLSILGNVSDEHGNGELRLSHEATFLTLLARLGVHTDEVEATAMWPEVRAFNTALTGLTMTDDVPTGIAALGMIEDLFAGISTRIGRGLLAQGWLQADELVHYKTHEELDVQHSDDFYRIVEPRWDDGPRARYQVTQGLELGGALLRQLYDGLWAGRQRRWVREVRGPHSVADGWFVTGGMPTTAGPRGDGGD